MAKPENQLESIGQFLKGVEEISTQVCTSDIDQFIKELLQAYRRRSQVFLIGNGGSAATASHFTADLNNCTTTIEEAYPFKALCLSDNTTRLTALTNDEGWGRVYTAQLANYYQEGDVVLGISVHGGSGQDRAGVWSQNLLSALQYAKDRGGRALGLTGFDGGAMKQMCDVCVNVPYDTTPHVEGFHSVLSHLISSQLTERISQEKNDL